MPQLPDATWSLDRWLSWQETLHHKTIEFGLDRTREMAARLGLLDDVPLTITVGGTNGKGSTTALLAGILRAAGYRVGLNTSPHLLRYNERIVVDGKALPDEDIVSVFQAVEARRDNLPLTYFEYATIAALQAFRQRRVDVQVLEVGAGGRLDAVNIIDADCTIITSVGLDHVQWLGPDRDSIGREKAGIVRAGRPAVIGDPDPPRGLIDAARERGARIYCVGQDFDVDAEAMPWRFLFDGDAPIEVLPSAMPGDAQRRNAASALAALRLLSSRLAVPVEAMSAGLSTLRVPGRFQRLHNLIFDVAHNAEAAIELSENLRRTADTGRTLLVLGMLEDKPVERVFGALRPEIDAVYCVSLGPPRGLSAEALARRIDGSGLPLSCHAGVAEGLAAARADAASDDRILVCGSFLTVSAALEQVRG